MFKSERNVKVNIPDDKPYTAFVDEHLLVEDPENNGIYWLRINIREKRQDSWIIEFPRQSSTGSQIPEVPASWAEANITYLIY